MLLVISRQMNVLWLKWRRIVPLKNIAGKGSKTVSSNFFFLHSPWKNIVRTFCHFKSFTSISLGNKHLQFCLFIGLIMQLVGILRQFSISARVMTRSFSSSFASLLLVLTLDFHLSRPFRDTETRSCLPLDLIYIQALSRI